MALFSRKKKEDAKDGAMREKTQRDDPIPTGNDVVNGVGRQPTNEEQMRRRQSSPQPTAQDYYRSMMSQRVPIGQGGAADGGTIDGFRAFQPIGKEAVQKATQTLQRYKSGKANLENRIIENEKWYKLRHWDCLKGGGKDQVEPTSGWLFNCIANKHADAMDNFPAPNVLPREEGDKAEAEMLTSILPVILDQNDFEKTYDEVWTYKLKSGTGVYGVFWDNSKLNGLGDIAIRKIDLLNLFWEPGVTDIQKSRNLFCVELCDNEMLTARYPQLLNGGLGTSTLNIAKYVYDDSVDTSDKSAVVDWYYKKVNSQGKQILHYCKYVNDVVLFATENDPEYAERGFYDHGRYPFEFDPLFSVEGTPAGFGYIDIGKSAQEYIDRGNKAILKNLLVNAAPRCFIRSDGGVNEEEYADMTKDLVHVDGNLGQDSILPIQGKALSDIYVTVINNKIDELKETTGNRDVNTGGSASGVTAASAIAALQESGSKLSRQDNKAAYRVYRQIILLCIELIRQFYDMPRCFRIMGQNGAAQFVQYSNAGIQPQAQGTIGEADYGVRVPLFDIEVTAEKQSPYSKLSQNELALQFYQAGFFNPQLSDQALACLDMMDFPRKESIMQKIAQNGTLYQQLMMLQQQALALGQMVDASRGGNEVTSSLAQQFGLSDVLGFVAGGQADASKSDALGGSSEKEAATTRNARKRVSEATDPT